MSALRSAPLLLASVILCACGRQSAATPPARTQEAVAQQARLRWEPQPLTLQEPDDVFTVEPNVSIDSQGVVLVADAGEGQVRRYTQNGDLLAAFGTKGMGPGEFRRPARALGLDSGEILVLDTNGRLSVLDSSGTSLVGTYPTVLRPLYDGALLGNRYVAIAGRVDGQAATNLVHVWDLDQDSLIKSFFPAPTPPAEMVSAYAYTGFADIATRGDTIAVLYALSDSVRFFDREGRFLRGVSVPYPGFRPLSSPLPTDQSARNMQNWLESFSVASDIFWSAEGTIFVQFLDVVNGENRWHVVGLRSDGQRVMDLENSPKLLAASPLNRRLLFDHPDSMDPNVWARAEVIQ